MAADDCSSSVESGENLFNISRVRKCETIPPRRDRGDRIAGAIDPFLMDPCPSILSKMEENHRFAARGIPPSNGALDTNREPGDLMEPLARTDR
jgi:hypothetical protein